MNYTVPQYLKQLHPQPEDEKCGFFMHGDKPICRQDGLECSYQILDLSTADMPGCTPETCVFYGVSSVPVAGWDNAIDE